ncbi:MAG: sodium:solute symporter family protein [Candidatus Eremiobacteraeota bacterium]|nr:sodium:solute symporter family protein [Candidatus Eremiobacteraeota bacterium]
MSGAAIALTIVVAVVAGTIAFGLWSVRSIPKDPVQYIVGGRSFGTILLWVLLAGEIYTSFTFLGMAGWAYGRGAPAYYIFAYGVVGYIVGYFLLPAIARVGKERGLLTAPDFFVERFGSRALGVGVAICQFVLLVPYVTLQLSGLQHILQIAGYGAYDATAAVGIAFLFVALFVFTTGLRGTAWASVIKDVLVLGAVLFAGIAIPIQFFGSHATLIDQVLRRHPGFLTLRPGTAANGAIWYVTTVLFTGVGFFMGPQSFNAAYSARSENTLRRNALFLPIYAGVVLLLVFFAGLSALLIVPGLTGPNADQSFLLVVQRYYPPWVIGFVAAAGALAALIPASALLLAAASLFAKNVLGEFGIATTDASRTLATRVLVLIVAGAAVVLWILQPRTLVELLLIYYNGVAQFAPATIATFVWRRITVWGAAAGMGAGLILAVVLSNANLPLWGINPGFVAMAVNAVVLVVVSLLTAKIKEPATASS